MKKWLLGAALCATLVVASVGGAAKSASAKVPVPQGIGAGILHGGKNGGPPVFPIDDSTPANTPETVSFILKAENLDQLEAQVARGMQGHYLSVSQFARQYGQSRQNIDALQSYLRHYGIATTVYADGLDVVANGTAGAFDDALSVKQRDYERAAIPAHHGHGAEPARRFHGSASNPLLPRQLASFVLSILGLSNYPSYNDDAIRSLNPTASANAVPAGLLTPADYARMYNLPSGSGDGSTIGIVTLASLDVPSTEAFWSSILGISTKSNRLTVVNVDGGPGAPSQDSGSDETAIDVEQSGALAPRANIIVYQAPNSDPGFLDGFYLAASDDKADAVSSSWGEPETYLDYVIKNGLESPTFQQTFDEVFLELAAQGQSGFIASGDAGAYDDSVALGTTNLDVDQPGNSPWVTDGGGTTVPETVQLPGNATATITAERAWGWDWIFPYWNGFCPLLPDPSTCTQEEVVKTFLAAGAGGGYSTLEPEPGYQRPVVPNTYNAVEYLTPTDYDSSDFGGLTLPTDWDFNPTPSVQSGSASGRGVPDLATDGDPETGYAAYFPYNDCPTPGTPCVEEWGGTSFVAPQLAGATAVIDANLGHRVGLWNPQIYAFAQQRNSPFHVLDSASADNDNLYYTGNPGKLWNAATGLGTPDLTALQNDFAHSGR
ncbi:MAG TPA: S53 family serine peptidase [Gaiellaceae bacterium]|nr:S53 family serine peptidase [Gaiellaceae bacterium]